MSSLLPREVRRRLAALRGGEEPGPSPALTPAQPPEALLTVEPPPHLPLGRALAGAEGSCLSFRLTAEAAHPVLAAWLAGSAAQLSGSPADPALGHGLAFLDLETLGLSAAPLFLVGLMHGGPEGLHVHQFLARDYAEEAAVLEACHDLVAAAEVLVTYNGLSFDWPYLADRLRYYRLPPLPQPGWHLDLLHVARRQCRGRLPNCSLTTVETHLLGLARRGDVPGADIPPLYHRAVAQEDLSLLAPVLHHNLVDLLSLACLAAQWRDHLCTRRPSHEAR